MSVSISENDLFELSKRFKARSVEEKRSPKSIQEVWNTFCWLSMLGQTSLTEAQVMYVYDILKHNNVFIMGEMTNAAPSKWTLKAKTTLQNELKSVYGVKAGALKSFTSDAILKKIFETLIIGSTGSKVSVNDWLKSHPDILKRMNNISEKEIKDIIAEISSASKGIHGLSFTKATLFFYHYGLGEEVTTCSFQIKDYLSRTINKNYGDYEDAHSWALINNDVSNISKRFAQKDPQIKPKHVDQAIWIMYQIANVLNPYKNRKVYSRDILRFIENEKLTINKILDIIFDLDEIDSWSIKFKNYAV